MVRNKTLEERRKRSKRVTKTRVKAHTRKTKQGPVRVTAHTRRMTRSSTNRRNSKK